jgi:hypothetical protein
MKNHHCLHGLKTQNPKSVSNKPQYLNPTISNNPEYLAVHTNHKKKIQILINLLKFNRISKYFDSGESEKNPNLIKKETKND